MIQFNSIILLIGREDNLKGEFVTAILGGQDNNAAESNSVIESEIIQNWLMLDKDQNNMVWRLSSLCFG